MAGAVDGVANTVGVVGIASWRSIRSGEPGTRTEASDAISRRNECRDGTGGEDRSSVVVPRGKRHAERADSQPAEVVAAGAVPSGDGYGV